MIQLPTIADILSNLGLINLSRIEIKRRVYSKFHVGRVGIGGFQERTISPKGIIVWFWLRWKAPLYGEMANALLHDQNWKFPFGLIGLRFSPPYISVCLYLYLSLFLYLISASITVFHKILSLLTDIYSIRFTVSHLISELCKM